MSSLIILIPIALILALIALLAFFWSVKNGQFDDLEGASQRIIFDDLKKDQINSSSKKQKPKDLN